MVHMIHTWLARGREVASGRGRLGLSIAAIVSVALGLSLAISGQSKTVSPPVSAPSPKSAAPIEDGQLYRNAGIGFRYQIPYGWVDRTREMQEGNDANKAKVLLAVFERPPDATGTGINSAVLIASENVSSYPGLKKAEDYLEPITELAAAKGFKADGEPYALEVESRQVVRADFVKPLAGASSETLTMHQCTLVLLAKSQIVSFTFIAGSDDELDDLMDGLHFATAKSSAR